MAYSLKGLLERMASECPDVRRTEAFQQMQVIAQGKPYLMDQAEHNQYFTDREKLGRLEGAGVDNWEGYDEAMDGFKE